MAPADGADGGGVDASVPDVVVISKCGLSPVIEEKYAAFGGAQGLLGGCVRAESALECGGSRAQFVNGSITAKAGGEARVTLRGIDRKWDTLGAACGSMGYPLSEAQPSACAKGIYSPFEQGVIFAANDEAAFALRGPVLEKWRSLEAECGALGLPLGDEQTSACGGGRYADFQNGSITWNPDAGTRLTGGALHQKWAELGRECSTLGYPSGEEQATTCGGGRRQTFERGTLYWSKDDGAHVVSGSMREAWSALKAECGDLGLPAGPEVAMEGGLWQRFAKGDLVWQRGTGKTDPTLLKGAGIALSNTAVSLSSVAGAYPRVLALANGELLAAFESPSPGRLALRTAVSTDRGWTWADRGVLMNEPANNNRNLANPVLLQLPSGRVLAAFRHHEQVRGDYVYRIVISSSDDNGRNFDALSTVEEGSTGVWEPYLFLAPDNSVHAYYTRDKANGERDAVMRRSTDGGRTWGALVTVASRAGFRDGLPTVARLKDGSLIAMFESTRSASNGVLVVRTVQSGDGGATWSQRRDVYVPSNGGKNAGAPHLRVLPDGRLLAAFMTDEDSSSQDWPNLASVKLLVSEPEASLDSVVWKTPAVVAASANAYWPGIAVGPGGETFVLFDQGGAKAKRVTVR